MKAIFEINGFQKIMEINEPLGMIQMEFIEPFDIKLFESLEPADKVINKRIYFELKGRLGEFLLYKYKG